MAAVGVDSVFLVRHYRLVVLLPGNCWHGLATACGAQDGLFSFWYYDIVQVLNEIGRNMSIFVFKMNELKSI